MWNPWRWWTAGDAGAVANAREAAAECCRRAVERAEVQQYCEEIAAARHVGAQHPA